MAVRPQSKQAPKSWPAAWRRLVVAKARRSDETRPATFAIFTIGHSTRPIEEFIAMLKANGVTRLIDVRTVPRSRHNPQFSRENLPGSLQAAGIIYVHRPALGGLRRTTAASPNRAWRNLSFRGYADYMQTEEFNSAVEEVIGLARQDHLALMCAEAVPWRCHRSLIADALLVRGVPTADISSVTRLSPHRLTPFAKVHGTTITYPPDPASLPRDVRPAPRRKRTAHPLARKTTRAKSLRASHGTR